MAIPGFGRADRFRMQLAVSGLMATLGLSGAALAGGQNFPRAILVPDPDAPWHAAGRVVIVAGKNARPVEILPGRFGSIAPLISPDGQLLAFDAYPPADEIALSTTKHTRAASELVVAAWSGRVILKTADVMARKWGSTCETIDHIDWVDNDRVGVGCFGGDNYTYSTIDVLTGRIGVSYVSWELQPFVWSPSRRHVAYAANMPHYPPNGSRSDVLMVDATAIAYGDTLGHDNAIHFMGASAWSPDGQSIAWIERRVSCIIKPGDTPVHMDGCDTRPDGTYIGLFTLAGDGKTMPLDASCLSAAGTAAIKLSWAAATRLILGCGPEQYTLATDDRRFRLMPH